MSAVKLYIGNIPADLSEADIIHYFAGYERSCTFNLVKKDGLIIDSRNRFGFLYLTSIEIAKKLVSMKHNVLGHSVTCEESLSSEVSVLGSESLKNRRLFIRNIKKGVSEGMLNAHFSTHGNLESIFIVKAQSTNKTRSFGYVTFSAESTANVWLSKGTTHINGSLVHIHKFDKESKFKFKIKDILKISSQIPLASMQGLESALHEKSNARRVPPSLMDTTNPVTPIQNQGFRSQKLTFSSLQQQTAKKGGSCDSHFCKPTTKHYFSRTEQPNLDHRPTNLGLRLLFRPLLR